MNHALELRLELVDGALVRVLGVAERRGWSTTRLQAYPCGRSTSQLARLPVVQQVEVAS